jgi:hypothetical protein
MPEIGDVQLMQYADGTLPPSERQAIEHEIRANPELQARLRPFLTTGKALARLFEPVSHAPLPDRLVETIWRQDPLASAPLLHRMAPARLWQRLENVWPSMTPGRAGFAFATAVTMAIGAAWWVAEQSSRIQLPGTLVGLASESVAHALETTPSGQVVGLQSGPWTTAALRVEYSFRHRDGRYCRQYELGLEDNRGFVGVACRAAAGKDWRIEVDAATTVTFGDHDKQVKPAGEVDDQKGKAARAVAEAAVDQMIVGDVLEKDQETALIRGGWSGN